MGSSPFRRGRVLDRGWCRREEEKKDGFQEESLWPKEGEEAAQITLAQLQDYDFLMKHFYSVHASTTAGRDLMKADMLLGTGMKLEQNPQVPQILIYHTHSQETYADYGSENPEATIVSCGEYLAELLRDRGWNVIHDTGTYDIQGGKLDLKELGNYALDGHRYSRRTEIQVRFWISLGWSKGGNQADQSGKRERDCKNYVFSWNEPDS